MNRLQWKFVLVSQVALSTLYFSETALANEGVVLTQTSDNTMTQVTSVSQLSDVQPTDWAFQALQSLVERYGCIAGYPNNTYRGNRAMTRYEFAAGLNACLDRVNELIATATADLISKEDLSRLRKLEEEFSSELSALRNRVDVVEAYLSQIEENQFSTTTKLRGEASFSVSSLFGDEKADGSGEDLEDNAVLDYRVRLNFDTSFTGADLLKIRLDALNTTPFGPGEGDEPNITGTSMTRLAFDEGSDGSVRLGKLFYSFPLLKTQHEDHSDKKEPGHEEHGHGEHGHHGHGIAPDTKLAVIIDAVGGEFNENFKNFNEFFSEELTGAVSRFGRFNPIYYQGLEGTGASLSYRFSDNVSFSLGYLAPNASDPSNSNGLFNGSYAALAQLSIEPGSNFGFGLTYARAYYPSEGVVVSGETGSELANAPFGEDIATSADHLGLQFSYRFSPRFTLSGWGGLTFAHAETGGLNDGFIVENGDDATIFNWAITLAFPDFGSEGSLAGIIIGQPPKVSSNDGGAEDDDSAWHLEAQYRYQLNDYIALNPGFFVIINPEHNSDNDTIWVATFRTIFEF
jgi:hypothetical protein